MMRTDDFAYKRTTLGHRLRNCLGAAAKIAACLLLLSGFAKAQSISVATASGNPGSNVDLPITFTPGATAVAGMQFDLAYSSPVTYVSISTGSAAQSAGKTASANLIGGSVRVLIFGFNANAIGMGEVAVIRYNIAAGANYQVVPITVSGAQATDPDA